MWQFCVGFSEVRDARSFTSYLKKCQVKTTFFFNGSTDEPLAEQLKSLYLKQEFSKFAYAHQGLPAAELQAAFTAFIARVEPENLARPHLASRRDRPARRGDPVRRDAEPVLDLHDIQGNIIKAYPRFGYPCARNFFLRVSDGEAARSFLSALIPSITTGRAVDLGRCVGGRRSAPARHHEHRLHL